MLENEAIIDCCPGMGGHFETRVGRSVKNCGLELPFETIFLYSRNHMGNLGLIVSHVPLRSCCPLSVVLSRVFDKKLGANPFKFAMTGASDLHSSVPAVEEDSFGGKFPVDSYPEGKAASQPPGTKGYWYTPSN